MTMTTIMIMSGIKIWTMVMMKKNWKYDDKAGHDGGEGTGNISPASLRKRLEWRLGAKDSAETIAKRVQTRLANGGFAHTEETKRKIIKQTNKKV